MLTDRLKEETHQEHVAVEKLIIPKIKNLGSNTEYAELLKLFYGYFKPVEERIARFIDNGFLADIDERRKAEMILEDISTIGASVSELLVCKNLPAINDRSAALGAMYVLEGSTLGGVHLSKMIADRMNNTTGEGISFFNGYGEETGEKWNTFKDRLDRYATSIEIEDKVIESANETFIKFKNWIEKISSS